MTPDTVVADLGKYTSHCFAPLKKQWRNRWLYHSSLARLDRRRNTVTARSRRQAPILRFPEFGAVIAQYNQLW